MGDSRFDVLNDLAREAGQIARDKGFIEASIAEDIALMHSELSEALEDHRAGCSPREVWYEEKGVEGVKHSLMFPGGDTSSSPRKPCGIPSEISDVIIRALHFCDKHEIDIGKAVREKMLYNATRPYKHGGKKL